MAKSKPKKPIPVRAGSPSRHLAKMAAKALLALGLAFGLLVGLSHLGDRAATEVVPHPRYTVAFADIETSAPPGRDRRTFLTEVRFLGDLPEIACVRTSRNAGVTISLFHRWSSPSQVFASFRNAHAWLRPGLCVDVDVACESAAMGNCLARACAAKSRKIASASCRAHAFASSAASGSSP